MSPNRVVLISGWLTRIGGGVNSVIKDQIDYLSRVCRIPVDVLVEGGDYLPRDPATLTTWAAFKGTMAGRISPFRKYRLVA